jgi:nitrate/nitrite transporter NarK
VTERVSRRALLVWSAAVVAYAVAVFDRTSLGVVSLQAAQRFGLGSAALASLGVLQLFVYAAMQIPVGMLLDRFGPRRLLLAGGLILAVAQSLFAVVDTLPGALLARVLLGVGDALTFVSVLRLIAAWFPASRNPLMVQLTGAVGQCGALASALPLVLVMGRFGWTPTYLGIALAGLAATAVVAAWVQQRPEPSAPVPEQTVLAPERAPQGPDRARPAGAGRLDLRQAWAEPGTRLGLWSHFSSQFSGLVFGLLWGFPFLTQAEGLSRDSAAGLLSLLVLAGIVAGPLLGRIYGRWPYQRSTVVLSVVAVTAAAWTVVLLWPGRAPFWLLVGLVLALSVNGPGSAIGFDFARTFNPTGRIGVATGLVNIGGFAASLSAIALIGVGLDVAGRLGLDASVAAGQQYSLDQFRFALASQYLLWGLGTGQVWRYRRHARRLLARTDPDRFAQLRAGVAVVPH